MDKTKTIAVTGHRPNKLWGYDLTHPCYRKLQSRFEQVLLDQGCTDAWTGMALGADTVFAHAVLALKQRGIPVKLHCAVPCRGQTAFWKTPSIHEYNRILDLADEAVLVTDAPYKAALMQIRNQYMVDRADLVLALWDGTPGGTANCVNYARRHGVPVSIVDPAEIAN